MLKKHTVQCPICHGEGGFAEFILDDGSGPHYSCSYCRGTGEMQKNKFYYQCLGWLSSEKRYLKRRGVENA